MKDIKLNPQIEAMDVSATLKINEKCAELKAQGKKIYNLGLGQSPFPVPKSVDLSLSLNSYRKDYLSCSGYFPLREKVADFYKSEHQIDIDADQVLIGTGSKILMFMLQIVLDGNVIIPAPSWVSYAPQAHLFNRQVTVVQTSYQNSWKITAKELAEASVSHKLNLLILNSPSNPTGQMYSADEMKELAETAKKNNVLIVSDEIYSLLNYGEKHYSPYKYYPEGTIIFSGLSKWCGAGGWRLGTAVFPKELKHVQNAMVKLTSESISSTCAPVQYAAVKAFSDGVREAYLKDVNRVLSSIANLGYSVFTSVGIKTLLPQGGFYFFLDFEELADKLAKYEVKTSAQLCEKLLNDTGVALLPGSDCLQEEIQLSARLAFVNFSGEVALHYASRINKELGTEFIKEFCPNTYEAFMAIRNWTASL